MSLYENILLAVQSLRAGKMRALLTMLGIIIGIGSVIAIVTVGNSLTQSITSSMDELGANQVYAYVGTRPDISWREPDDKDLLTDDMVFALSERFSDRIDSVGMFENLGGGEAKDGRKRANVSMSGTSVDELIIEGAEMLMGHDISERDVKGAKYVAVVSDMFVRKMFPGVENPLGQEVKIHTAEYGILTFSIVGVYVYEPPAFMSSFVSEEDIATTMTIPVTTAKRIKGAANGYDQLSIIAKPGTELTTLTMDIEDFLNRYYANNTKFQIYAGNNEGFLNTMTSTLVTISIGISVIAAISLLVGGIGVMNIMLVSVTERTREIGTRKALGARSSAIRYQFIVESMIICLIGGIIGIITGLLLGFLGSTLMGFPAAPSIPIIVIAVVFSVVIGVFFGFYPANKAAKLDPIEALRYE